MRLAVIFVIGFFTAIASGETTRPSTAPAIGKFPFIQVDPHRREVRVECESLRCEAPLEFFCCVSGTNEHESVLRSKAKPSNLHTALLMLGLTPGEPVKYSEAANKWFPPHGPPLSISVEYRKNGKQISVPAYRLMRDVRTKHSMPPATWVFAGSQIMPNGAYAADATGYLVSIVNFELTVIDVPQIASSANETLEWEADLDALPAEVGTPVTMIIQPVDTPPPAGEQRSPEADASAATTSAPSSAAPSGADDSLDLKALRARWDSQVRPHGQAMRDAAQAQYELISKLRREQQRLIDQADKIQRLIDELEHDYQQLTTPRPATTDQSGDAPPAK